MKISLINKIKKCIEATSNRKSEGDKDIKKAVIHGLINDVVYSIKYFDKHQMKYLQENINQEEDLDIILSRAQKVYIQWA